ncbi:MAG: tyrosine--tRNA ligase [Candidatus Levyibacteriota bacterium]
MDDLLSRGVANIIPSKEKLEEALNTRKLNIYLGIDPTSTKIHLGHAVPLRKLQKLAEAGHHVTFLIGDFTALIGDTSDKDAERPVLTSEQIEENFHTYKKQAEKILDFSKVEVKHNSEWLSKLTFQEIVKLCQHFSFGDFASRELIKKRLTEGKKVGLHEALYPVMQGYDSYFMKTDIQLGGTDQTFNMQAGRTLIKALENRESYVMTNEFLTGTDGRKMSKSWGNAIWLEDEADNMYGKVMSIKDDLIMEYFKLGTNVTEDKLAEVQKRLEDGENPMALKKELAFQIVAELHSEEDAKTAQEEFERTVQHKATPTDIQTVEASTDKTLSSIALENNMVASMSEWRRLWEQKGLHFNGEAVAEVNATAGQGGVLKVGKLKQIKIEAK